MRFLISLLAAAVLLSGCALFGSSTSAKSSSTSSGSLSDSASSPSSLSSSGSKNKAKDSYQNAVIDYTAEYANTPGAKVSAFRARMNNIAEKYSTIPWQEDRTVYVAIGKGLRKADVSPQQFDAFKSSLGEARPWKMDAITEGYR
jgi:hypothetical protein